MMTATPAVVEDPYLWLEEVESKESLDFAVAANEACLKALGNPETGTTYQRILAVLESEDRIPYATVFGKTENNQDNTILFNFWKDSRNPKGLWRKCDMASYRTATPDWTTVLDVDQLAEQDGISWVWKGSSPLPRSRDPLSADRVTRALLSLSRGGSDAVHVKEFDLTTGEFVRQDPFNVPEGKTRASYKSRNVLLVGADFGPESLTDSGYPRTVREWVRGTDLQDAPVVFEGEKTDVSVSMYISDERVWVRCCLNSCLVSYPSIRVLMSCYISPVYKTGWRYLRSSESIVVLLHVKVLGSQSRV
jgi:prolyl oligopeptidase